jgi:hypothetical protein
MIFSDSNRIPCEVAIFGNGLSWLIFESWLDDQLHRLSPEEATRINPADAVTQI